MGKRKRKSNPAQADAAKQAHGPRFETPPKVGPGQVLAIEQFAEATSGSSRRVRNHGEHPLSLAYHRGQLETKYPDAVPDRDRITARERMAAGEEYRQYFEKMHRSGKDSTDMCGGGGGGGGTPWTGTQAMAIYWIKKMEGRMHHRNTAIIRAFCGERYSMVDALRKAMIDFHPNGVTYRVREALDDLVIATTGRRRAHAAQHVA